MVESEGADDGRRNYRIGVGIVVGFVIAALGISLIGVNPNPETRAAENLSRDLSRELPGGFRLIRADGTSVGPEDLADRVWVASFIFTRCRLSCPRITTVMKGLADKLADTDVRLASVTVDPEHDTPEVLRDYAERFGADASRWWFLTGEPDAVRALVLDGFALPLAENPEIPPDSEEFERFAHAERLALVDVGNRIVGYYDAADPAKVEALAAEARRLGGKAWVRKLPSVNAGLNATSAGLLAVAWLFVLRGRRRIHGALMTAALIVSAAFLACYLVYHYHVGSVAYRGTGVARYVYFTILISHVTLAVVMLPPLLLAVYRAARRQFDRHRRVASLTFPIWMYVSVTGVVVYFMLYA